MIPAAPGSIGTKRDNSSKKRAAVVEAVVAPTAVPASGSAMALAQQVLATEGVAGFYTGLSSGLCGMGCSWFTYYFWFNFISDMARADAESDTLSNLRNLLTAAQAGTITCVLMEPVWVVNTRAKLAQGEMGSVSSEILKIGREEGLLALFGGLLPSLLLVSNPSIQFMVAEYVKASFQVLKTRLQRKENKDSIFTCALRVLQEDGWAGFYRGMGMKISQTVLTSAFMFYFYSIFVKVTMALLRVKGIGFKANSKRIAALLGVIIGISANPRLLN